MASLFSKLALLCGFVYLQVVDYFWYLLVFGGLLYFYLRVKSCQSVWKRQGVVHDPGKFLVGSIDLVRRKAFPLVIKNGYDKFPGVRYYCNYQFLIPNVVLKDADLIKQITIKEFDHFTDHRQIASAKTDPFWRKNLFASRGQEWKELRSTLSPSFTSSKMKFLFKLIEEVAQEFVDHFKVDSPEIQEIDFNETLRKFTTNVIASTAFGIKCNALKEDGNEFYKMGQAVMKLTPTRVFAFFVSAIHPTLANLLNIKIIPTKVADFFSGIVKENIKNREEKNIVRPDMIHLLMEAMKGCDHHEEHIAVDEGFSTVSESEIFTTQKKKEINIDDITAQALLFFLAGFDTIATHLSFLFYELALNPNVQDRLREELNTIPGEVTYENLLRLKYLDMVVSEALRKWPPAVVTDREVGKTFTIVPVRENEKPLRLEPGMVCSIPIYAIHNDPENYPEPERFDPERFNEENRKKINPSLYLPFGAGPRSCIGSRFALLESKLLAFHVVRNFEIVPVKKTNVPMVLDKAQFNVCSKGGMWLGLKKI